MTRDEYQQLRHQADEEHRRNIEAIERIWAFSCGQSAEPATRRSKTDSLVARILRAVKGRTVEFTTTDIVEYLGVEDAQRPAVSGALKKLARDPINCIEVVHVGSGSRPSRYRMAKEERSSQ